TAATVLAVAAATGVLGTFSIFRILTRNYVNALQMSGTAVIRPVSGPSQLLLMCYLGATVVMLVVGSTLVRDYMKVVRLPLGLEPRDVVAVSGRILDPQRRQP